MDRRTFLHSTTAAGALLTLAPALFAQDASRDKPDDLNVAVIGLGLQGSQLLKSVASTVPAVEGVRIAAVCDIQPAVRARWRKSLQLYGHEPAEYAHCEEMLAANKCIHAAVIATPDHLHAPMTVACLKAGMHVYCEAPMSVDLQGAADMIAAARLTGKLLQIGYQRRSDPRYIAAEEIARKHRLLGRVRNVNAQSNRCSAGRVLHVHGPDVPKAILKAHDYDSMHDLVNWRLSASRGAGPLARASGQLDAVGWLLGGVNPISVMAAGGRDYFNGDHDEEIMVVYEYQGNDGSVRAFHQILNTTIYGAYGRDYEVFMGDEATLVISAVSDRHRGRAWLLRESHPGLDETAMRKWQKAQKAGLVGPQDRDAHEADRRSVLGVRLTDSCEFRFQPMLTEIRQSPHHAHLANFLDAVRGKAELNCPGDVAYQTAVAVLKTADAVREGKKIHFTKADFTV